MNKRNFEIGRRKRTVGTRLPPNPDVAAVGFGRERER